MGKGEGGRGKGEGGRGKEGNCRKLKKYPIYKENIQQKTR